MSTIFVVFSVSVNNNSVVKFDIINLCATVEVAKRIVKNHFDFRTDKLNVGQLVHPEMRPDNYYTYVGKTTDCTVISKVTSNSSHFGGYVIEEMNVDDASKVF